MNSLGKSDYDSMFPPLIIPNPLFVDTLKEKFPALGEYQFENKTLNEHHLSRYGNQDSFQTKTEDCVRFILAELHEITQQTGMNEKWFDIFLRSLGGMRHEIAVDSGNEDDVKSFGRPRKKDVDLLTPISSGYSGYLEQFKKYNKESFSDDYNNQNYNGICLDTPEKGEVYYYLSFVGLLNPNVGICMPMAEINEKAHVCNTYSYFWQKDDPVFKHVFRSFKEIVENKFLTPDELRDKIADFHWLFANVSPFMRGSAWVGEVLTDACWLFHGYVPVSIEHGKSLDLEAMSTKMEAFRNIYPMGRRI